MIKKLLIKNTQQDGFQLYIDGMEIDGILDCRLVVTEYGTELRLAVDITNTEITTE